MADFVSTPGSYGSGQGYVHGSAWRHLVAVITAPSRGLAGLMQDPRRLRHAMTVMTIKALLYTVIIVLFAIGGMPIMIPAWLAIPADQYYVWESFFIAPVTFGAWILAAGVVHLLAGSRGGQGRFEDVVAATAFAIVLPSLATIVPDLAVGLLTTLGHLDPVAWATTSVEPGPWRALIWTYLACYLVALLVLFPIAVAAAHRLDWWRAVWVGTTGAVVYQGVYFVFVR